MRDPSKAQTENFSPRHLQRPRINMPCRALRPESRRGESSPLRLRAPAELQRSFQPLPENWQTPEMILLKPEPNAAGPESDLVARLYFQALRNSPPVTA